MVPQTNGAVSGNSSVRYDVYYALGFTMTDPTQIARGIAVKYFSGGDEDGEELIVKITTALREYGEAEYKRGLSHSGCKESYAEGFVRGHSQGYAEGVVDGLKKAKEAYQRGQESGK